MACDLKGGRPAIIRVGDSNPLGGSAVPNMRVITDSDSTQLTTADLTILYQRSDGAALLIVAPTQDGLLLRIFNGPDDIILDSGPSNYIMYDGPSVTNQFELNDREVVEFISVNSAWYLINRYNQNRFKFARIETDFRLGLDGDEVKRIKLYYPGADFGPIAAFGHVDVHYTGQEAGSYEMFTVHPPQAFEPGLILSIFSDEDEGFIIRCQNVTNALITPAAIDYMTVVGHQF